MPIRLDELYDFVLAREILNRASKPIQFRLDIVSCLIILQEPVPDINVLSVLLGVETSPVLDVIQ